MTAGAVDSTPRLILLGKADRAANFKRWVQITYLLSMRTFRVRYLRSRLGILWAVLQPLIQALVLAFVFQRIFKIQKTPHYPVYLLSGVMAWQCFQTGMVAATTAVVDNAGLVRKIAMPSVIFPLAQVGAVVMVFFMQLVVLFGAAIIIHTFSLKTLILPLGMILLFAMAAALGVLFCSFQVAFRDIRFLAESGALVLYYVTPILYDPKILSDTLQRYLPLNPMYGVITIFRSALLEAPIRWGPIGISAIGLVIISAAAGLSFRSRSLDFADLA